MIATNQGLVDNTLCQPVSQSVRDFTVGQLAYFVTLWSFIRKQNRQGTRHLMARRPLLHSVQGKRKSDCRQFKARHGR